MSTSNNKVMNMNTNSVSDAGAEVTSAQVDGNPTAPTQDAVITGDAPEVSLTKAVVKSFEEVTGLDPAGPVRMALVQLANGSFGYVPAFELATQSLDGDGGEAGEGGTTDDAGATGEQEEAQVGRTVDVHARKARQIYNWIQVVRAYEAGQPLKGKIVGLVRGGVIVNVGHRAFMPASHVDVRPVSDLAPWVDKEVTVLVLRLDNKRMEAVVSRRALLDLERKEFLQKALDTFKPGDRIKGVVRSLLPYGAFVEISEGVDAFLHVSDMSWRRLAAGDFTIELLPRVPAAGDHGPGDGAEAEPEAEPEAEAGAGEQGDHKEAQGKQLAVGDELEVVILKVDSRKGKINVGRKQLLPDPWEGVEAKYPVGSVVEGTVTSHVEYGAFVELEPGLEGMVHVSEITHSDTRETPAALMPLGTKEQLQVIDVDGSKRRIGLSKKALTPDPWAQLADQYPAGSSVTGVPVAGVADFGLFIRINEHIKGLVHRGEISWQDTPEDLAGAYPEGTLVNVKVLDVDLDKKRVSLSMKQMEASPWDGLESRLSLGDQVEGQVLRVANFGAFVQIEPGVEGLVHISRLADERVESVDSVVKVGDTVKVTVVGLDLDRNRLSLSMETDPEIGEDPDDHFTGSDRRGLGRGSKSKRGRGGQDAGIGVDAVNDKRSAGTSLGDLLRNRFGAELETIVGEPQKD